MCSVDEGVYLVLLALAIACVAACHLPLRPPANTVAAAAGVVLSVIAAILALLC